jgi:hypothetical protein
MRRGGKPKERRHTNTGYRTEVAGNCKPLVNASYLGGRWASHSVSYVDPVLGVGEYTLPMWAIRTDADKSLAFERNLVSSRQSCSTQGSHYAPEIGRSSLRSSETPGLLT